MKTYIKKSSVIIVIMYNYPFTFILPQIDLLKKAKTNTLILQRITEQNTPLKVVQESTQWIQASCITLLLLYNYFSKKPQPNKQNKRTTKTTTTKTQTRKPHMRFFAEEENSVFWISDCTTHQSLTTEFCNLKYLFARLQSPGKSNSLKMVRGEKKHFIQFLKLFRDYKNV